MDKTATTYNYNPSYTALHTPTKELAGKQEGSNLKLHQYQGMRDSSDLLTAFKENPYTHSLSSY